MGTPAAVASTTHVATVAVAPASAGHPQHPVLAAIRDRRSIGRVRPERPDRATIARLLEAATWAPNHRLTQPWRFVVLAGEARNALGETIGRAQAARHPEGSEDAAVAYAKAAGKPLRAPVVIAVAVEPTVAPKVVEIEEVTAGAAAIQNLLLAAHAEGLAAIWRTGDPCYDPAVKAHLGLPEGAFVLGFVYLGYPDGAPPTRERIPAPALTRWLGWDDDGAQPGE